MLCAMTQIPAARYFDSRDSACSGGSGLVEEVKFLGLNKIEEGTMLVSSLEDQVRAASLMVLVAMLGVAIDGYVIYAIVTQKVFGHSFGAITISQMVATCGNSFMFAVFVGPITIQEVSWHSTYLGTRIGQLLMIFWNASLFSHLLTAINRFVNLYFTYKYEIIFSKTVTYTTITIVWVVSIAQGIPYFWRMSMLTLTCSNTTVL
uniref:7TM_GPCR_Srx domain-containing protein n=1 Tax=Steinernema glaseri TaxID=37863 RepID=A0A1I8ALV3_9BILA